MIAACVGVCSARIPQGGVTVEVRPAPCAHYKIITQKNSNIMKQNIKKQQYAKPSVMATMIVHQSVLMTSEEPTRGVRSSMSGYDKDEEGGFSRR